MKAGLTYDDVALVPQYNNIPSRLEPSLSTWLTKEIEMKVPILAANMDTVISTELAKVLESFGSIPLFHRFTDETQKRKWKKEFPESFISVGINDPMQPFDRVLIDIAHAHDKRVELAVESYKKLGSIVIVGNVCTSQGYIDLVNAGADAVKVGIGPGAACTTRMVTGFGVPQFTAVREIAKVAKKLRVPIIADGGIRGSRDIVLALAAGASSVMIGKLFAGTDESPSDVYRGQASKEFQEEYFGELKEGTVPEGKQFNVAPIGPANNLINNLLGGVRSGLTYGGARSIKELQRKAEFIRVTSNYLAESNTRV